uniref:Mitochondrial enolase superfamily member 1 n=1 Tax=Plectus sambesii TaxID=2011161 RepID=A0A914V7Z6_9BILA
MNLSDEIRKQKIAKLTAYDVRFPTSLTLDGSDAVHTDPDYSIAYVVLKLSDSPVEGHGFAFTIGNGTDIVVHAIESYRYLVEGRSLGDIYGNFGKFWRDLTNDSQLRWLGPEKGVVHMACAAILNALWDAWGKLEKKPVWKLVSDFTPEQLLSVIDFRYMTDAITQDEALQILRTNESTKAQREQEILKTGIPAYVTSVGWMGYSDEKIKKRCEEGLAEGWKYYKMKVGVSVDDDYRRAKLIRSVIGYENKLMMDANQVWDVQQAIDWMHKLAEFKPLWIEEPTSPDDVLGHEAVAKAMNPLGIGVATGEHCANRVMFKQLITRGALQFCQVDGCRTGSINELLSILLLAAKHKIPVCPHAGGVGLCELVQHISIFNYICIAPTFENQMTEFANHLHEHFIAPVVMKNGRYHAPLVPGYSAELKKDSLEAHIYPHGSVWKELTANGQHKPRH